MRRQNRQARPVLTHWAARDDCIELRCGKKREALLSRLVSVSKQASRSLFAGAFLESP